eukprot:6736909-Prymnesium_polylepis.1
MRAEGQVRGRVGLLQYCVCDLHLCPLRRGSPSNTASGAGSCVAADAMTRSLVAPGLRAAQPPDSTM